MFAGNARVYLNNGSGAFTIDPVVPVNGIDDPRSVSFADIDNDGDLDFVYANKRSINMLVRNDLVDGGNWLKVNLVSPTGLVGAFGAKTRIFLAGEAEQSGAIPLQLPMAFLYPAQTEIKSQHVSH